MRSYSRLAITGLMIGVVAATPASGEQIKYYVWTDANGVIHAEDRPPTDGDYETRVIEADENVVPAPAAVSGNEHPSTDGDREALPRSPRRGLISVRSPGNVDAAVADEEQRRLDNTPAPVTGGAATAPGAIPGSSGSGAPGAAGAPGATTATGAATAPGAPFVPRPLPGP
ncbi:MAG: DUF4124 domain-containing protein [Gammaproteobacteria bacterium]|nr:DUF4124 domain-containing protein [Gammaproteobacteria bacterium]